MLQKSLVMRLHRERLNLDFLSLCKELELISRFIRVKSKFLFKIFRKQALNFERSILNLYIRRKYADIDTMEKRCRNLLDTAFESLPFAMVNSFVTGIEVVKDKHTESIDSRHLRKIAKLSEEAHVELSQIDTPVRFLNESSVQLTEGKTNKGPKFVFRRKPNFKSLVPQLESILSKVNEENKIDIIRANIVTKINKYIKKGVNCTSQELEDLKSVKKRESISILLTDKTCKIVIIDKSEYIEKNIKDLECVEVKKNPIDSLKRKAKVLIKDGCLSKEVENLLLFNDAAIILKLFGRLKDHKANNTYSSQMHGALIPHRENSKTFTKRHSSFPSSPFVISSTADFVNRIKKIEIEEQEMLVSLDIVSLLTSINTLETEKVIFELLDNSDLSIGLQMLLRRALSLILRSNYLEFNGKIYLQNKGAPMGSPYY